MGSDARPPPPRRPSHGQGLGPPSAPLESPAEADAAADQAERYWGDRRRQRAPLLAAIPTAIVCHAVPLASHAEGRHWEMGAPRGLDVGRAGKPPTLRCNAPSPTDRNLPARSAAKEKILFLG